MEPITLDLVSSDSDEDKTTSELEEHISDDDSFLSDKYSKELNMNEKKPQFILDFTKDNDDESKSIIKIVCIDPAPKNAGFCISNWETSEITKVFKQSFVNEKEEEINPSDPGNTKLVSNVTKFIESEKKKKNGIFTNLDETFIFIENQTVGGNSFHNKEEKKRSFTNSKNITVQNVFQTTFGSRCTIVNPRSIKTHFKEHFPVHSDLNRSQQYRQNKKNAISFGKTLLPQNMRFQLENKYKKTDDIYDAVVMKKYVEDTFEIILNKDTFEYTIKNKRKKKDKKTTTTTITKKEIKNKIKKKK